MSDAKKPPSSKLSHEEIRELLKDPNTTIEMAERSAVEDLAPYVQKVLDVVADIVEMPGISHAWVSDRSKIWDFLVRMDENTSSEQLATWKAECCTKIGQRLGLDNITQSSYIHELAKQLRVLAIN